MFVSLANGDITVYSRDHSKSYNKYEFIRKEKNKNIVKYKQQVKINLEYKIRNKIFFGMIYNKSNNLNLHKIVV